MSHDSYLMQQFFRFGVLRGVTQSATEEIQRLLIDLGSDLTSERRQSTYRRIGELNSRMWTEAHAKGGDANP